MSSVVVTRPPAVHATDGWNRLAQSSRWSLTNMSAGITPTRSGGTPRAAKAGRGSM